jgi:dTDP-4-dehydrorhamnose 3,5-epimerase
MKFLPTQITGVIQIEPEPRWDDRGFLARTYCDREFSSAGLNTTWVQHNHTLTRNAGTIRGLHWQAMPAPETKLVRCLRGRVLDVAVDIRRDSPTFGAWTAVELSGDSRNALYIPGGFAHGFQCLTEECELLYLMSASYEPNLARGVRWDDPAIGISWPLPGVGLSERDQGLPLLSEIES